MGLCNDPSHLGYNPVTDDVVQTRLRYAVTLSGGAGSVTIEPPTGQFWIIDRVTAQVDTGGTATFVLYDGAAVPNNAVSGGVAQAGLGFITGAFDPPVEVGQEGLTLALAGVGGSLASSEVAIGVWYRRRFKVAGTPKVDREFGISPSPVMPENPPMDLTSEAPDRSTMPLPAIAFVDDGDRQPGVGDVSMMDDTYV